jgi:hypothetical protein
MMMTTVTPSSPAEASDPQSVESERRTPWWRRFWVLFAATTLGLGGLAIYGATRSTDRADVFSWDEEDLAGWITEDDMTAAFEDALTLHGEGDFDGEVVLDRLLTQPDE